MMNDDMVIERERERERQRQKKKKKKKRVGTIFEQWMMHEENKQGMKMALMIVNRNNGKCWPMTVVKFVMVKTGEA